MSIEEYINNLQKPTNADDDSEDNVYFKTHCRHCGKLFENCTCDCKRYKRPDKQKTLEEVIEEQITEDIDDLELDEMNDVWDEMDSLEKDLF